MKYFKNLAITFTIISILSSVALEIGNYESRLFANVIWILSGVLLVVSLILVIIDKRNSKFTPLPEQEEIESLDIHRAELDDLQWISNLEKSVYKRPDDQMPFTKLKEWYGKNPNCFWIIKADGERIGNMYLLPVIPSTMERLRLGEVLEKEITAQDIYSPKQIDSIKSLYISSLVAKRDKPISRRVAAKFLKNLPKISRCLSDPLKLEAVYSLSASPEGFKLLNNYGFTEICRAEIRKDKHSMYSVHFRDLVEKISKKRLSPDEAKEFSKLILQLNRKKHPIK